MTPSRPQRPRLIPFRTWTDNQVRTLPATRPARRARLRRLRHTYCKAFESVASLFDGSIVRLVIMVVPIPENEERRIEALGRYEILDTPPEQDFDDLTLLASHICDAPIALITLIDKNRQWFKSKVGLGLSETARDLAFCAHTIAEPDVLIVRDATADPRFAGNPLVLSEPHIRFYAGATLMTSDGYALGSLCVIDRTPRDLTGDQMDALRALSRQTMVQLEIRRIAAAMARLNRELEREVLQRKEAEEQYRHIVENVSDIIYKTDAEGRMTYWNSAIEPILKFGPSDVTKARYLDLIHPDYRAAARRFYQKQWLDRVPTTYYEFPVIADDGRVVWLGQNVRLISNNGSVTGFQALARDITERRQAQELLEKTVKDKTEAQRLLQAVVGRYVSQDVAAEIIRDPERHLSVRSQKREVTVLFCDLRGFTSLSEKLDPDVAVEILNRYLTDLIECVFEHRGTLDKFHGDGVMCFFSDAEAKKDAPVRAVQCALRLRSRVNELRFPNLPELRLSVGIGINTGIAIVGTIGSERRMDHTVIGDAVNIAQRLESIAAPDQILLGPKTHEHVMNLVRADDLGFVSLQGRQEAIHVFAVTGWIGQDAGETH